MSVLNCPGCRTKVADGTSICPKCDYIIDASFLSSEPPSNPGGDIEDPTGVGRDLPKASQQARTGGTGQQVAVTTGTRRAPTTPGTTGSRPALKTGTTGSHPALKTGTGSRPAVRSGTGSRPAVKAGSSRSVPAIRPSPPAEEPKPDVEEEDWRIPPPPPSTAAPKGSATGHDTGIVAPEEIIADTRAFIGELSHSDKIAFASACLIILSCFLPWKETAADGEILGLMSAGIGTLLGAALIIGAIFVRKRGTMPKVNASMQWMMQLGVSFLCILYTVIFIKVSFDTTQVQSQLGNAMVWASSPSFGVFLGLLGALGALVGSVMGLRERS
ncbi:MAG TPA: hypothetical protein VNA24_08555 [Hyalangium sp.]|nr:hypothetical protein [Hyalangium sp.]